MANDLKGSVWVVDTASATAILTSWARVRKIEWIGATTAGHEAIVQDQNSRVVFRRLAQGANQNLVEQYDGRFGISVNGLIVPTLTSGTIYIHFLQGG